MTTYASPKVENRSSKMAGRGLFAKEKIDKGEIIIDFTNGLGQFVDGTKADDLFSRGQDHMIQVDDDLFFAAVEEGDFEDADYLNHSCEPNCGIKDKLKIVAMRNIHLGEELTVDYAMMESSEYNFVCNCGSRDCRKVITGNDWKIKGLQEKYKGYFSDYLAKKIYNG